MARCSAPPPVVTSAGVRQRRWSLSSGIRGRAIVCKARYVLLPGTQPTAPFRYVQHRPFLTQAGPSQAANLPSPSVPCPRWLSGWAARVRPACPPHPHSCPARWSTPAQRHGMGWSGRDKVPHAVCWHRMPGTGQGTNHLVYPYFTRGTLAMPTCHTAPRPPRRALAAFVTLAPACPRARRAPP